MAETLASEQFETLPAHELTREDFQVTAEDIFSTYEYAVEQDWSPRRTHSELTKAYVEMAEDPRLADFGRLLITAEMAARTGRTLDELADQGERRTGRFDKLKLGATRYNHLLRGVISEQPRLFTREQLSSWMERASGDSAWTERLMKGMVAEVATAQRLAKLPGVESVRYSTAGEERLGIDVVAELSDGGRCNIDVKFGDKQLPVDVLPTRYGVAMRVEADELAGFGIAPAAREQFMHRLERAVAVTANR